MKITVELDKAQAEALLTFLRRVSFEAVAQALTPEESRAFEKASEKLRVALRGVVEPDWSLE